PPVLLGDGCEKLYDTYNELYGLAQEFHTPFDAPTILVVSHRTDGMSALVGALMRFQFNLIGGRTKTRRPIILHLKYNALCEEPLCHLVSQGDPMLSKEKSLDEIQAYIEAENMRLEFVACQFSTKEITIGVEYKYCPNLTIIDTPGLVAPAPGKKNRMLQHKEFIILCLENCSDWSNATTRWVVMQIDPELSRTVVVSTKLDTKILQFARSSDVEGFLKPPARTLDGSIFGGSPFFTSVPYGRAVSLREIQDIASLEEKLGRSLSKDERSRIGVSSLRLFLEELLRRRYMDSVPLIIPLLEKEYRGTTRKLHEIGQELELSLLLKGTMVAPPDKFGNVHFPKFVCMYVHVYMVSVCLFLNFSNSSQTRSFPLAVKMSLPELITNSICYLTVGETLQDERVNGGAFHGTDGLQIPYKFMSL
ncbi:Dynamin-like protein, partial [Nymphaea thermarum]